MTNNPIGGFLLLHKPPLITSHRALSPIKRCFDGRIGHTGTLDPMATGTLVCAIGQARKFIQYIPSDAKKSYRGTIQLGCQTDTGDITGNVINTLEPTTISCESIQSSLATLTGEIMQRPPIYSALKYKGKPYYVYARSGQKIPIQTRPVTIEQLELIEYCEEKQQMIIEARVSAGTYIRSLAEDIANQLNTIGCLSTLERLTIEPWTHHRQYTIDQVTQSENPEQLLLTIDSGLRHLPELTLEPEQITKLRHGIKIPNLTGKQAGQYRAYDPQKNFQGIINTNINQVCALKMIQTHD